MKKNSLQSEITWLSIGILNIIFSTSHLISATSLGKKILFVAFSFFFIRFTGDRILKIHLMIKLSKGE